VVNNQFLPSILILPVAWDGGMGHPCKLAASLKTPTGCFLYARAYHPGEERLNGSVA